MVLKVYLGIYILITHLLLSGNNEDFNFCYECFGCTYLTNYNADVNFDDGSCDFIV